MARWTFARKLKVALLLLLICAAMMVIEIATGDIPWSG